MAPSTWSSPSCPSRRSRRRGPTCPAARRRSRRQRAGGWVGRGGVGCCWGQWGGRKGCMGGVGIVLASLRSWFNMGAAPATAPSTAGRASPAGVLWEAVAAPACPCCQICHRKSCTPRGGVYTPHPTCTPRPALCHAVHAGGSCCACCTMLRHAVHAVPCCAMLCTLCHAVPCCAQMLRRMATLRSNFRGVLTVELKKCTRLEVRALCSLFLMVHAISVVHCFCGSVGTCTVGPRYLAGPAQGNSQLDIWWRKAIRLD